MKTTKSMGKVELYIYDLSNGLAAQISLQLTGRFFRAIYHTSIVVHEREYFFGGSGIESSLPGRSPYGTPLERRFEGNTDVSLSSWQDFLSTCAHDYGVGKYHLLEHNCNTFSDAALQFLLGQRIDTEITSLPSDFLSTPLGMMLRPQIDAMYSTRGSPAASAISNGDASTRLETPIDGPTSGGMKDRVEEAFDCPDQPSLVKLFNDFGERAKNIGPDATSREHLRHLTESIGLTHTSRSSDVEELRTCLISYFDKTATRLLYPGIDLARILLRDRSYQERELKDCATLEKIYGLDLEIDSESFNSQIVFLKLVCNNLVDPRLRFITTSLLQKTKKLDLISISPLSPDNRVMELGLKVIWNMLILVDGIDDDFRVACLASTAECVPSGKAAEKLRANIILEIRKGGSEAIQDMVELLELNN